MYMNLSQERIETDRDSNGTPVQQVNRVRSIERGSSAVYVDDGKKPGCSGWNQSHDETMVISSDDDSEARLTYYNLFYISIYSIVTVITLSPARIKNNYENYRFRHE